MKKRTQQTCDILETFRSSLFNISWSRPAFVSLVGFRNWVSNRDLFGMSVDVKCRLSIWTSNYRTSWTFMDVQHKFSTWTSDCLCRRPKQVCIWMYNWDLSWTLGDVQHRLIFWMSVFDSEWQNMTFTCTVKWGCDYSLSRPLHWTFLSKENWFINKTCLTPLH